MHVRRTKRAKKYKLAHFFKEYTLKIKWWFTIRLNGFQQSSKYFIRACLNLMTLEKISGVSFYRKNVLKHQNLYSFKYIYESYIYLYIYHTITAKYYFILSNIFYLLIGSCPHKEDN